LLDDFEEAGPGARHPSTRHGSWRPSRYVPRRRKSPEMIEADGVDVREQRTHAVDAPPVAAGGQCIPIMYGIAPPLSFRCEIVCRHTCDHARPVRRVEEKQLRVGPHIARIRGDEEG